MKAVDVEGFFKKTWMHVADAERAAGEVVERWFEIARLTLRLRFIGSALVPYVAPALMHLEIAPRGTPDLTLHCCDCATLALEFPKAPVSMTAFTPRGEVHGLNNRRFHGAFEMGGKQLSLFDSRMREAVYCVGSAAGIPRFEIAEPIRAILSWLMREHGRQLIHAAAVGKPRGGVLIIGPSGAGKSNTALGCYGSNLQYAADDFCAVSAGSDPKVFSLYCTGKTHECDWDRHPLLAKLLPDLDPERREKAIYFLNRSHHYKLISEFPLKAILVPCKGGALCEMRPISPATALRIAAPDTAKLLPDAGSELLRCMAQIVRTVPSYQLMLGSVPERIPTVISALLADGIKGAA